MTFKPLNIPADVNVYEDVRKIHDADSIAVLKALHTTFRRFRVDPQDFSRIGNALLRFAFFVDKQTEPILPDDPATKQLAEMWEDFHRRLPPDVKLN